MKGLIKFLFWCIAGCTGAFLFFALIGGMMEIISRVPEGILMIALETGLVVFAICGIRKLCKGE